MTVRARWTTFGIALATSAVLVGVGCTLRGAEVDAEYDRYHVVAEQFWQGHVVFDRFHPFGYPLLVAALLPVVGDSLLAGVVVSALAAGLLVWAVGSLAERLRAGAGVPAASLAAVNGWLWVFGTMASTDAAATASMTAALAIVAHGGEWRHRRALAGGVCAGFAVACRFASAAVVPVGAVWAWWRGGLRGAALFALGALVGYLPHAVVATWTTGAPLGNDNWHLLYLKAVCGYEIECLQRTYEAGTLPSLTAFLGQHGGELLRLGAVDLGVAVRDVLPAMVCGAPTGSMALAVWPLVVAAVGLVLAARARTAGGILLGFAVLQATAVCLTYAPRPRFLFGVLPPLLVGVAVLGSAVVDPRRRRLLFALLVALSLVGSVACYRQFLALQPLAEVALLRRLPELVPRPMCLLTTLPIAERYVPARVLGYMAPPQPSAEATWDAVRERMVAGGADVFATGRVSNGHVFARLATALVPSDFTLLYRDDDVLAVERLPEVTPWIAAFTVEPATPRVGDRVTLTLRLAADAPAGELAAGVALQDAAGAQSLLDLPPVADGTRRAEFVLPAVAGAWQLTPFLLRGNGQVLRGAVAVLPVAP